MHISTRRLRWFFLLRREIGGLDSVVYVLMQVVGGLLGAVAAHTMFEMEIVQASVKLRSGGAQWLSESIATFGLILAILLTLQFRRNAVAMVVGLYITAAYWFVASTSFANPAVTIARSFTDTFSGIYPAHAPAFIGAQIIGALCALGVCSILLAKTDMESA